MNKSSKDLKRINGVLQGDRGNVDDKFIELFTVDVTKVIKDYFNLIKKPLLLIDKKSGELIVNLSFSVDGIKMFKKM